MHTISEEIKAQLSFGEQLLWSGQPRQGVFLSGADVLLIPFSLMWGGFAIFWEATVLTSGAPAFFVLWGLPFVLIALYLIVGRFFFDAKQRARTFYAVTSERILIISGLRKRKVKSLNLSTLPELSLSPGKGDEGTISFGGGSPISGMIGGLSSWPGAESHMGPRFVSVAGARSVFETIRGAQRAA